MAGGFVIFAVMIKPLAFSHTIFNQTLLLLPQKAVFWQEQKTLIVADVHLGKVGHFRKAGIAIPKLLEQEDLATLSDLINEYKPENIIFLGDLFHSDMNNDWDWFVLWRELYKNIRMLLVKGNHDILQQKFYDHLDFETVETLHSGPFLFSHEPLKPQLFQTTTLYAISGHIHPGVTLHGRGRQKITLPCFHFGVRQAILPAFGRFTGNFCIRNTETDQLFGVMRHKIISLQSV